MTTARSGEDGIVFYTQSAGASAANTERLTSFIRTFADRRVTSDSITFYQNPNLDCLIVVQFDMARNMTIMGVSAVASCPASCPGDFVSEFAVTAVHPDYRGRGIGERLLKKKLSLFKGKYTTRVGVDNTYSLDMCARAGLTFVRHRGSVRLLERV